MKKELNPELFTDKPLTIKNHGASPNFLKTDEQIFELKQGSEQINIELDHISMQLTEFIRNSQLKFDQIAQKLGRLEQSHNGFVMEAGNKLNHMNNKLIERKTLDNKIQETIDRHNNVIKGFEVRISHLQKLLAEKDAQLLAAQTLLNETKMEISRIKRM